jgi:tetratricopeptide (TPR) repeat protein
METTCEASHEWQNPARFRRVCPLLVETPAGLRCSVDARDVRPFWGRACASYLRAFAALFGAGALILFVGLRIVGYPLSPTALIWPPRWHEIRLARSDYFVSKARHALDEHRINEAIASLDLAYRDNPQNYDAGFQLAQLTSIGRPEFADSIFASLTNNFPKQRAATSEAWLISLFIHGELVRAGNLAASRLVDDAPGRSAWMHALFNATRHSGDDQTLRDLVNNQATHMDPIDVALINSELMIRQGRGLNLLPGLTAELPQSAGAFAPYFQISRLDGLGRPAEALALLDRYSAAHRLAEADAFQLRLDILAELGRNDLLRERLAHPPINSRELELISVHLVRHPDPVAIAALGACLRQSPVQPDVSTYSAYSAYLVACGASRDWAQMHAVAGILQKIVRTQPGHFATIEAFFRQKSGARIESVLPMLPGLSLDLIYALYDRYDEKTAVVTSATTPPR